MKLLLSSQTVNTLKQNRMHPVFLVRDDGLFESINSSGVSTGFVTHAKIVCKENQRIECSVASGTYLLVSLFSSTQGDVLANTENLEEVLPVGSIWTQLKYWLTTPSNLLV